jgi:hypothetical protein
MTAAVSRPGARSGLRRRFRMKLTSSEVTFGHVSALILMAPQRD